MLGSLSTPYRQRRQHGWTCRRPLPRQSNKEWSPLNRTGKMKVSRFSCVHTRADSMSLRALPVCSSLISMNKGRSNVLPRETYILLHRSKIHNFLVPPRSTLPRPNQRRRTDTAPPQQGVLPQLVEILKVLGCSQDVMDLVKSNVEEKTKTQHKVPGVKERMLHVLKMKLTKAKSHLVHLQGIEKKKEEEHLHAREQVATQEKYLADVQALHCISELLMAV